MKQGDYVYIVDGQYKRMFGIIAKIHKKTGYIGVYLKWTKGITLIKKQYVENYIRGSQVYVEQFYKGVKEIKEDN